MLEYSYGSLRSVEFLRFVEKFPILVNVILEFCEAVFGRGLQFNRVAAC